VDIRHVNRPGGAGEGVVVVYVPKSEARPHRVIVGSRAVRDHYFMRTTTECEVMPHALVELLFLRRPLPRLKLVARFSSGPNFGIVLHMRNEGSGAARQPAIELFDAAPELGWEPNGRLRTHGWTPYSDDDGVQRIIYEAREGLVVYPRMSRLITRVFDRAG